MKELSIEEKAKAYDRVSKEVKDFFEGRQKMYSDVSQTLEYLFPELKESEDEKIRKRIIHALHGDVLTMEETNKALAWLEKQGNNTPTIIWHNIDEKPKEMEELFCEWESDDATWHDVAFYDEESHTFRHARMPINVTKWVYVDELLEKQGEQKPAWSEQDVESTLTVTSIHT